MNEKISVKVVFAMPESQHVLSLNVDPPCTARQAVNIAMQSGLETAGADFVIADAPLGIYGVQVADSAELKSGDRVEIYRPLKQDPKELRRQRAASESGGGSFRRK